MGQDSKIEWTHHTANFWRGCTKVSEVCKNCYADTLSKRNPKSLGIWGPSGTRPIAAESYWREPAKWNEKAKAAGEVHRVFCSSLADVGEGPETIPADAWDSVQAARRRIVETFEPLENLVLLLLTKRPENMPKFFPADFLARHWVGTSVENQKTADERIPHLLRCPAAVRFLSCEPLLGSVDLGDWIYVWRSDGKPNPLHWVIVGGESGPGARPMHPDWARSIRDQCAAAGVPYFFKQYGDWGPGSVDMRTNQPVFRQFESKLQWIHKASTWVNGGTCIDAAGKICRNGADFEAAVYPVTIVHRVGKSAAGRLLDGVAHNAMPTAAGEVAK